MFFTWRHGKKGSTLLEYSVLFVALMLGLLAIHFSLRRAIAGRWRQAGDSFGDGRQYDPAATVVTVN
jgi:Flp pilus assembly pilin Flp